MFSALNHIPASSAVGIYTVRNQINERNATIYKKEAKSSFSLKKLKAKLA